MAKLTKKESKQICECCGYLKLCHMYTLQNGEAAFVCKQCRKGS